MRDGKRKGRGGPNNEARAEFNQIFEEVKELGRSSLTGIKGKKHKEDILTKLGAPPVKAQKMPFKMKIGLMMASEKRNRKEIEQSKESGVVLSKNKLNHKNDKKYEKRPNKDRGIDNIRTKGGIYYLPKNFNK